MVYKNSLFASTVEQIAPDVAAVAWCVGLSLRYQFENEYRATINLIRESRCTQTELQQI